MTILLVGGGSGGHITPLLAVARELKALNPKINLLGVCETDAKFINLFKEDSSIDAVYQVDAGKYRRYAGLTRMEKIRNYSIYTQNIRDIGRVVKGYTQARKLLKKIRPDGILIKGGFVGVPIGLAAAHLKIPFITHDSDSTPGLANRLIAKWALKHATGMPVEFYDYPKNKTVYTGVPIGNDFNLVTPALQAQYREEIGLKGCDKVVAIIGASQGAQQLNEDVLGIAGRLMQKHHGLGIIHIAGPMHEPSVKRRYNEELLVDEIRRVIVKGFVTDVFRYTGAADVVISRASATVLAELAVQGRATVLVPGQLSGDHQGINARHFAEADMALVVGYFNREGLANAIDNLLSDHDKRLAMGDKLHLIAKPQAAKDLANLLIAEFSTGHNETI
jgi:UDP-N-acetylglucosamine--N-acetylmuramyl-(pentapeptide) pyrophosphoryl-undecaprenol N-acetylglucosamine transferase